MGCRNCVGSACNACLLRRSVKTGLVFFIISSPQVADMTGNSVLIRTALFIALIFLLMKLSKMRSGYVIRDDGDISKSRGAQLLFEGADF